MLGRALGIAGAAMIAGLPAWSGLAATIRAGDHPGFSRIVVDLPPSATATSLAGPQELVIHIDGDTFAPLPSEARLRNVDAVVVDGSELRITLVAGARTREQRLGTRFVIDVLDPTPLDPPAPSPAAKPPGGPAKPPPPTYASSRQPAKPIGAARELPEASLSAAGEARRVAVGVRPMPTDLRRMETAASARAAAEGDVARDAASAPTASAGATAGSAAETSPDTSSPASHPATSAPARLGQLPARAAGTQAAASGHDDTPSLVIPCEPAVGAAAFSRGNVTYVVLDTVRPISVGGPNDQPAPLMAEVRRLSAATLLRLALPAGSRAEFAHVAQGWTIGIVPGMGTARAIIPRSGTSQVLMAADNIGASVTIADPDTGALLLVGTQRASGQAVLLGRRAPEFVLLPTQLGVVVEPLSDALVLRALRDDFVLEANPGAGIDLAVADNDIGDAALADGLALTRRFGLTPQSAAVLDGQLRGALAAAAAAPPLGRLPARLDAARSMIGLGMGAEAEALIQAAADDDPTAMEQPDVAGLQAAAALLAGRPGEADGIDDARLSGTDEVAFWRAIRIAMEQEGATAAADTLAATSALLFTYPRPLRDALATLVAETMALGGQEHAAQRLLDRLPPGDALRFARAILRERRGDTEAALADYDTLAAQRDRYTGVRAARRAVELRLSRGTISNAEAAAALEPLLLGWRGDARELELRLRVAALRFDAGSYRAALTLLRETEAEWPERAAEIHGRLTAAASRLFRGDKLAALSSLELATLVQENADLLPDGAEGDALAVQLAERLTALDLPGRAAAVLDRRLKSIPPGPQRAAIGLQLAEAQLRHGDPSAALSALATTAVPGLPADIAEARTLAFARAAAARGDTARADIALTALATPAADAARAALSEGARDWPAAVSALGEVVARSVPPDGTLSESQQNLLLRYAEAAVQAGDRGTLDALGRREVGRMHAGPHGDMFALLTAPPVQTLSDLPRAKGEIALARALPSALARAPAPRP